jgi:glycosyltransferase involved in cell wall biosynthesis
MHIVFYISRFGIGGIQTFVIQLAKELIQLPNVKVSIFCHHPEQVDTSANEAIPPEIEILTLSKNKRSIVIVNTLRNWIKKVVPSFDLKEWLTTRFFLKMLQKEKVTIVHNNIELGDENVYRAQQKLGIPYITTLHGAYKEITASMPLELKGKYQTIFNKLLGTASSVVYLSSANLKPFEVVLGDLSTAKKKQFVRIFNGINAPNVVDEKEFEEENLIVFGLIARGVHYKGWEEAILATKELVNAYPERKILLKLYGKSDYLNELEIKYQVYKDFVLFCGSTDSPLEAVQSFTIGLLPTYLRQEEMPFTIIEYLACCKPVIATDKGAIVEMLTTDGQIAGEIIKFDEKGKADVNALKKAMEQFLLDPVYKERKALLAQQAFEKFDVKNTAQQYYNIYQKALKK